MKIIREIAEFPGKARAIASKAASGKWERFWIALDYFYCRLRFHVTDSEYLNFQFYNFKNRYRKNFLLRTHQNRKFKKLNAQPKVRWSKYSIYQTVRDCYAREVILAPACGVDTFVEFARNHKKIVIKPNRGSLGRDVTVYHYQDDEQACKRFLQLTEECVCEEFICQHEKMSELSPDSVNTIRFVSLWEPDGVKLISATLRTGGQSDSMVDNLKKDGIGAQIDLATGIVYTNGFDYKEQQYVKHPLSGTQFLGFNIPNWEEAVALVKKGHAQMPETRLIGWDIAITQTGADMVEANNRPGTPITQMVDRIPKGERVLRAIRAVEKKKH